MDVHSKNLQDQQERTDLKHVAYTVTADARSGDIINMEGATNINRDAEHRLVEGGPRDLVTVLWLRSVSGQG